MNYIFSFDPLLNKSCKILVVGSMPSPKSLEKAQYYENPRNHFWGLMGCVLGLDMPEDYAERCQILLERGIGLYDSIQSCIRPGALDSNIKNDTANDINHLVFESSVRLLAFNGRKSYDVYYKNWSLPKDTFELLLPSSSPIPRKNMITLEDKLPFWLKLRDYL